MLKNLTFYLYRMTYDIEMLLPKKSLPQNLSTTMYEYRYELLSISIGSIFQDTQNLCVLSGRQRKEHAWRIRKAIHGKERKFAAIFHLIKMVVDVRISAAS